MINPKEQVQAITTRCGVQLQGIHMKRADRKEKEVEVEKGNKEAKSTPIIIADEEIEKRNIDIKSTKSHQYLCATNSFPSTVAKKEVRQVVCQVCKSF